MTDDILEGRVLGGYRILRRIGRGGMATVYKAHEESLNRVVALKVIHRHLSDSASFVERFRREAQAAASLVHPNIVQIYAIGEDDGFHYFSMEYVKGRSLSERIGAAGALGVDEAVPVARQVARALDAAHEAGIVHRDIKPANILLDDAGQVKVVDFGIAHVDKDTRLTKSGMLVGTPEYLSPEQCRNESLDGRCDIYALGITLYQMLSGRVPFEADSVTALLLQIVEGRAPALGEVALEIPREVQDVVARMMATDRDERYATAGLTQRALETVDPTVPSPTVPVAAARTPPLPPPAPPSVPPRPPAAKIAGPREPSRAEPFRPRRRLPWAVAAVVLGVVTVFALGSLGSPDPESRGVDGHLAAAARERVVEPAERAPDGPGMGDARAEPPPVPMVSDGTSSDRGIREPALNVGSNYAPVPSTEPDDSEVDEPRALVNGSGQPEATIARGAAPPASRPTPAAEAASEPFPVPSGHSVVAETSGEYEYVELVNGWVEDELFAAQLLVVDFASSPAGSLPEAARHHVVTTARLVSTRELEFFGRFDLQYTVALTMRAVDLTGGATVAGPETTTVSYTAVNLEQNLERATRELARRMSRALRRTIDGDR